MKYDNYFRIIEDINNIKIDSTLKSTITSHFAESDNSYTEQDLYEVSHKIIQRYKYSIRKK